MSKMPDEKVYKEITTGVEFKTNEVRNGKNVYGKEVDCGLLQSGRQEILHNISNIDEIICYKGRISHIDNGTTINIPRCHPTNPSANNIDAQITKNKIMITAGTDFDGTLFRAYITVYYTKN